MPEEKEEETWKWVVGGIAGVAAVGLVAGVAYALSQPPPTAQGKCSLSATSTSCTAPCSVKFTASVSGGTPPYNYVINYGDGGGDSLNGVSATSETFSHTYTSSGTYTATLTVTDSAGGQCTSTVTVTVSAPAPLSCSLSASPTSGDAPLKVTFTMTASGGSGQYNYTLSNVAGYVVLNTWQSGNTTSGSETTTFTYSDPGTYTATLTVTDVNTQQSCTKSVTITVNQSLSCNLSV